MPSAVRYANSYHTPGNTGKDPLFPIRLSWVSAYDRLGSIALAPLGLVASGVLYL